jgi:two-component system KDP operon response regulator KdpE
MEKTRILVVDDEQKLVRLVREVLTATGYEVLTAYNGTNAVNLAALEKPDLIVLDLVLPGELDGYATARRIREFSDVPIIMLTARVRENDMLRGFEAGADDYMTKPFSARELLVRIRSLLKRANGEAKTSELTEIVIGNVKIDLVHHKVFTDDIEVRLTPTEYNLLRELARHLNQVMLHEQLLVAVWGAEFRNDHDYLRAYIHHLRQKLEADPANPKLILRSPGVGYMLVDSKQPLAKRPKEDKRVPIS